MKKSRHQDRQKSWEARKTWSWPRPLVRTFFGSGILLHGGLGPGDALHHRKGRSLTHLAELQRIARRAQRLLIKKAPAVELALATVYELESCPLFNAGYGSKLQSDGQARLSASLMRGADERFCSLSNIEAQIHPSQICEGLLNQSDRNLMGVYATGFGVERMKSFKEPTTPARYQEWQDKLSGLSGTVGAVALDDQGTTAACTSTGGRGFERPGRVSDSSTPAGNFANPFGAVSCTGVGEEILEAGLAVSILTRLEDGQSLETAVDRSFFRHKERHFGSISIAPTRIDGRNREGQMCVHATKGSLFFAAVTETDAHWGMEWKDWRTFAQRAFLFLSFCLVFLTPREVAAQINKIQFEDLMNHTQRAGQVIPLPEIPHSAEDLRTRMDSILAQMKERIAEIISTGGQSPSKLVQLIDAFHGSIETELSAIGLATQISGSKELKRASEMEFLRFNEVWFSEYYFNPQIRRLIKHALIERHQLQPPEIKLLEQESRYFDAVHVDEEDPGEPHEKAANLQEILNAYKTLERLEAEFLRNIEESDAVLMLSAEDLAGVPQDFLNQLKVENDRYRLEVHQWYQFDIVRRTAKRARTRERVYRARYQMAVDLNSKLFENILHYRHLIATRNDQTTFLAWQLDDTIFSKRRDLDLFLKTMEAENRPTFLKERRDLRDLKRKLTKNKNAEVYIWDIDYLFDQQVKAQGVDAEALREYFPLEHVLETILQELGHALQIEFLEVEGLKLWDPQVKVYAIRDNKTQAWLGLQVMDLFPRDGKDRWFFSFGLSARRQLDTGLVSLPTNLISGNFPPASPERPSLVSPFEDIGTILHELGHGLHDLLTESPLAVLSGYRSDEEFVETPSTFLESLLLQPRLLKKLSKHYERHEPLTDEQIQKLIQTFRIGAAHRLQERLVRTRMDYLVHDQSDATKAVEAARKHFAKSFYPEPAGTSVLASFGHIGSGYEGMFWSYIFGSVLASDFQQFAAKSSPHQLTTSTGLRYRDKVLKLGGTVRARALIEGFLGRKFNPCRSALRYVKGLHAPLDSKEAGHNRVSSPDAESLR